MTRLISLVLRLTILFFFFNFHRSFLGVTVHYIDEKSLERRSAELLCQRLSGHHTYDVIATALHVVFVEYKILHKICVVITDNSSNFEKAFRAFREAERDQDFEANNITEVLDSGSNNDSSQDIDLPQHKRCAAHTLNLVASVDAENAGNNGTYRELARNVFSKLKTLWRKRSQSVQAAKAIEAVLGRHLHVPNAMRWNSLFNAMKYVNEVLKGKMDARFDTLSLPRLQHEESMFIDEYCKAMYAVAKALDILQGEQYM
ncbi:hypothetical protein MRX96_032349 [Rhipicephalus microplus]